MALNPEHQKKRKRETYSQEARTSGAKNIDG
jgi:hypothetical protein